MWKWFEIKKHLTASYEQRRVLFLNGSLKVLCNYYNIKLTQAFGGHFQFTYNMKNISFWQEKQTLLLIEEVEETGGKEKKNTSPPCGPESIHCSRLISFGCIILSVSMANLTVPKAQAPDWSIQNQTTNYWAHHSLPLPFSVLPPLSPPHSSLSLCLPLQQLWGSCTQEQQSGSVRFPLPRSSLKACPIMALQSHKHA